MSFVGELQNWFSPILNLFKEEGPQSCVDLNIYSNMISSYQCSVHKAHAGDSNQDSKLDEFATAANSNFGVTANELKQRMPCCNNSKVIEEMRKRVDGDMNAVVPFCCKTTQTSCPPMENVYFGYESSQPFNGVCYATGILLNEVINPADITIPSADDDTTSSENGAIAFTLLIIIVVCILLYKYVKDRWKRQSQEVIMKKLVYGLEDIDKVY